MNDKIKGILDKFLGGTLIFLMGTTVIMVLWQVFSRYIVKKPSVFTDELSGFLLMWIGLLGAAYATGQKMHLAIDLLPNALHQTSRSTLNIIIHVCIILFAGSVMVWGGFNLIYLTLSLDQLSATLQIPLGYVYTVLPISGLFICYYCLVEIFNNLKHRSDHVD